MSEYVSYGYTVRCMVWSNSTVLQRSIYMGCDEHLYRYKVEDDTYVYIGSVASNENIKRLWINGDNLYGAAWADPSATSKIVTVRVISYNGTNFISSNTISGVFTGEYCLRDARYVQSSMYVDFPGTVHDGYLKCTVIGKINSDNDGGQDIRDGESLLLPFSQYLRTDSIGYFEGIWDSTGVTATTYLTSINPYGSWNESIDIRDAHNAGYHSLLQIPRYPDDPPDYFTAIFSLGQYGCVEFINNFRSNGGIFYATISVVSQEDQITYRCYDLNSNLSQAIIGMSDYSDVNSYPINPTCCTMSLDSDVVYFGGMAWYTGDTVSRSYLTKVSDLETLTGYATSLGGGTIIYDADNHPFGTWCVGKAAYNTTDGSSCTVLAYVNGGELTTSALSGGGDNTWQFADAYRIGEEPTITTLYQSTSDAANVYRTFLDMKYANYSVGRLFVTYLNRDNLGKGNFGGFGVHSAQVSYDYFSDIKEFFSVPTGLVVDNKEKDGYYTLGSGSVYQFDRSTNLHILADSGNPFVDGESYQSSNLCVIPLDDINVVDTDRTRTEDIIFGVSAPFFPNETQAENIMGKYYLWKLDNYISDRVELADFEGMNVWGALTQLAQLAPNYTMGFDLDDEGSFFLTSKTNSTYTTTLTVSSDPDDKNLISIDKDRGLDEIFNYVAIVPTAAMIQNADKQLYLSPRTEDETKIAVKVGDILVDIVEKYAIYSKSICIREGNISVAHSDVKNCAIFKFQTVEREIEAVVVGDVAAGGLTITVASTFRGGESTTKLDENGATVNNYIKEAINLNDYFTFINPDTLAETNCRITNISDTSITIATAPGFAVASGTVVVITHPFYDGTDSKVWSSEGVTTVVPTGGGSAVDTIYVTDTRDLSANCIIGVHSDSTITYVRVLPDDFGVYYAAKAGYTLKLTGDTVTCGDGTVISAYYSPSKTVDSDYDYFEIGGSGVSLRINPAANTSNVNFKSGDRITIKTEGMKLENLEQAKQIALDSSSIATYGRIEYTGINNKFLSRALAKQYVKLILNDYKNPKYILTVETLLSPTLAFRDTNGLIRIKIFDKKLFPKYSEVIAYPRSITHNLRAGTTSLVVRDNDAY